MEYEASLKAKWDTQNAFDYAIKKAQEEEHAKAEAEKLKSANSLKKAGVSSQIIAESLNLPLEVIEKL